jgi:hypothetical protein
MYTTPCDVGYYYSGGSCVACASGLWSGSGTTCSTTYSSTVLPTWNNGSSTYYTIGYTNLTTGKANTAGLIGTTSSDSPYDAAKYWGTLSAFGHADWYLPAASEMVTVCANRSAIGNFDTTDGTNLVNGTLRGEYWTSSESSNSGAQVERLNGCSGGGSFKNIPTSARCVRR